MAKTPPPPFAPGETPGNYSVMLWSTEGGSDKLYGLTIEQRASGLFVVNFTNGRRGANLSGGTKTQTPVPYETAREICTKILKEKLAKGYDPVNGSAIDGAPAGTIPTIERPKDSGLRPQLLNAITDAEAIGYVNNDDFIAQPKKDGERRPVDIDRETVQGINKKGQTVAIPDAITTALINLVYDRYQGLVLDAEQIGEALHIFDLIAVQPIDAEARQWLLDWPLGRRLALLTRIFSQANTPTGPDYPIQLVPTANTTAEKRAMLENLRQANEEGIVFKRVNAPYISGRPASYGDQVKLKFYETITCIVASVNAKRSIGVELIERYNGSPGRRIPVGNVTVPPNQPMPAIGDFVEVRYLYAYENGSLFQPTLLGIRTDVDESDCDINQRKLKKAA
jgi:bifunctional non-homologous end joining protein LigD